MDPDQQRAAEAECLRLTTAFAVYLDNRQYGEVADLFTPDALYNPRGTPYRGRQEILGYLNGRPATRRSRHVIANQLVRIIDARTAEGTCALLYFVYDGPAAEGVPAPLDGIELVGDYHDRFVRTGAGWRIARRIGTVVFQRQAPQA
jgi:hypothetical protein